MNDESCPRICFKNFGRIGQSRFSDAVQCENVFDSHIAGIASSVLHKTLDLKGRIALREGRYVVFSHLFRGENGFSVSDPTDEAFRRA